MEAAIGLRLADVFVCIDDPRQASKVKHDLVELLVVAVNAALVGADTFVEIELWAQEKLDWLRKYLRLEHGIPSHDTFGRLFGLIDPEQFEAAFRRWVSSILPALGAEIVAIDGKPAGVRARSMLRRCIWFRPSPPGRAWLWGSGLRPRSPTRLRPFPSCFPPWR